MLRVSSIKKATDTLTDEELLERYVSSGDHHILGALYQRYMRMVYGVCLNILKDANKAEDAVMGIYETVAAKSKEHQIGAFRPWVYTVARNYCLMEWRKQQRAPTHYQAPENMVHYDAVEQATEFEFPQKTPPLQACLAQLNELQRQCVLWFYYEDKSYKDIATTLKEEVGKVRSHIQNGKRNLRLCLERS